jgi:hypothetical protein
MSVVIDEVHAEVAPEPRAQQAQERREQAPKQDGVAFALAAVERERFRQHRLSDR